MTISSIRSADILHNNSLATLLVMLFHTSCNITVHHLWVCALSRSGFNNICECCKCFLRTPLVRNWRMLVRQLGAGVVYWLNAWNSTALKEIILLENRIIRPTWKKHDNRAVQKNAFDQVIDLIRRFWNIRKVFYFKSHETKLLNSTSVDQWAMILKRPFTANLRTNRFPSWLEGCLAFLQ